MRAATSRARAAAIAQHRAPIGRLAARGSERRTGHDLGAAQHRIARRDDGQAGIVGAAIAVGKTAPHALAQRCAEGVAAQINRPCGGQRAGAAQPIIEREAGAQHPARPRPRPVRQYQAQRLDEMRRHAQQHLALGQPLAHQAEGAMLEIAQPAMDQLARRRGRGAGEVALLAKQHAKPPPGGVAGNRHPVDAAADDQQVIDTRSAASRRQCAAQPRQLIEARVAARGHGRTAGIGRRRIAAFSVAAGALATAPCCTASHSKAGITISRSSSTQRNLNSTGSRRIAAVLTLPIPSSWTELPLSSTNQSVREQRRRAKSCSGVAIRCSRRG